MRIVAAIAAIVVIVIAIVLVFLLSGDSSDDSDTGTVTQGDVVVPIELLGASNVGALQLELLYDESQLEFDGLATGSLGQGALLESLSEEPGVVGIGLVNVSGMSGSGSVVDVSFSLVEDSLAGPVVLELANVEIADTDLRDLVVQPVAGNVSGSDLSVTAPGLDLRR